MTRCLRAKARQHRMTATAHTERKPRKLVCGTWMSERSDGHLCFYLLGVNVIKESNRTGVRGALGISPTAWLACRWSRASAECSNIYFSLTSRCHSSCGPYANPHPHLLLAAPTVQDWIMIPLLLSVQNKKINKKYNRSARGRESAAPTPAAAATLNRSPSSW